MQKRFQAKYDLTGVLQEDAGSLIAQTNELPKLYKFLNKKKNEFNLYRVILTEFQPGSGAIPIPEVKYKIRATYLLPWHTDLSGFDRRIYEYGKF